ncbi:MAG: ClpP family protease, partial [Planctomycetota bacterium]
ITAEEIIKIRKRYNRIVADATGRDPEDILKDVERDFWLSSEEALEYKLVDRILTSQSEI